MDGPPKSEPSILVIDDNADAAFSLAMALESLGCTTFAAYGGTEALDAAERIKPDVVLLDLRMPGMDGFEACNRIRQLPCASETIIIAVTGSQDKRDEALAAQCFAGVFLKPAEAKELKDVIETLWKNRQAD